MNKLILCEGATDSNEQIKSVSWEESEVLMKCFGILEQISDCKSF